MKRSWFRLLIFLNLIKITISCTTNSDCLSISGSKCSSGSCTSCTSKSDCTHIGGTACALSSCVVGCSSSSNAPCLPSSSVCKLVILAWVCLGCSADNECSSKYGTGWVCASISGKNFCKQCRDTSGCTGGKVCDNYACGPCTSSSQCLSTLPRCDPSSFLCSPCQSDADCSRFTSTPYCGPSGVCVACVSNTQCTSSTSPLCSSNNCQPCSSSLPCPSPLMCSSGSCVECTANSHCTKPKVCLTGNVCGLCGSNADCKESPYLNCDSGICFQCSTDDQCAANQYCDFSTKSCLTKECSYNSDCSNILPVCFGYKCKKCSYDSDCTGNYPFCSTNGSCIECFSNSDCSGNSPICSSGICVACSLDTECNPKFCSTNGSCLNCLNDSQCSNQTCLANTYTCGLCKLDSDCPGSKYCRKSDGLCYGCLSNENCNPNRYCNLASYQCVSKQCLNDADCSLAQPRCDPLTFMCGLCLTDSDCSGPNPSCDAEGACVASLTPKLCSNNADCNPSWPICSGSCSKCTTNSECGGSLFCKTSLGICVQCLGDSNCTANQICLPSSNICGVCTQNSECPSEKPLCNGGICYECLGHSDCATGQFCTTENFTCISKNCDFNTDCSNPTPVCDLSIYNCSTCKQDSDCDLPNSYCHSNGSCYECTQNRHCPTDKPICTNNNVCHTCESDTECGTKYCNSTGFCVECLNNSTCSQNKICNPETSTCEPCKSNAQCLGKGGYCLSGMCASCRLNSDCPSYQMCIPNDMSCHNKSCFGDNYCSRYKPVCDLTYYQCSVCASSLDCNSSFPVCHTNGSCLECLTNSDCSLNPFKKICIDYTCSTCKSDSDCPHFCNLETGLCTGSQCNISSDCLDSNKPRCSGNVCYSCVSDSDCSRFPAKSICSGGNCTAPTCLPSLPVWTGSNCTACNLDSDCIPFKMEKKCISGKCINCTNSSDCQPYAPICDQHNYCSKCNTSSQCVALNPLKPGCRSDGQCVDCTKNIHCSSPYNSLCNLGTYSCIPCESDSDCSHFTNTTSLSLCLDGLCVPCSEKCLNCLDSSTCLTCESPYRVINGECGIDCIPGWTKQNDGTCAEICGDGVKRLQLPYCDDGNNVDGDGCSSNCKAEDGWLCEHGGKYTKDICRLYPKMVINQSLEDYQTILITFNQKMTFPSNISAHIQIYIQGYSIQDYSYTITVLSENQLQFKVRSYKRLFRPIFVFNFTTSHNLFIGESLLSIKDFVFIESMKSIEYVSEDLTAQIQGLSSKVSSMVTTAIVLTGPTLLSGLNPAMFFALISAVQTFYYLLYINTDYPQIVKNFLQVFSVIVTFDFIPNPVEWISPGIKKESLPAPERFLELGKSGYFLAEDGSLFMLWSFILLVYLTATFVAKFLRFVPFSFKRYFNFMIASLEWSGMIGTLIASYLSLTISSLLQCRTLIFDTKTHGVSSILGIFVASLNFLFIIWVWAMIKKYQHYPKYLRTKFGLLTVDFNNHHEMALYFNVVNLIKRYIQAIVYVFLQEYPLFQCLILASSNLFGIMACTTTKPFNLKRNYYLYLITEYIFLFLHSVVFIIVYDNMHQNFSSDQRISFGWLIVISAIIQIVCASFMILIEQIDGIKLLYQRLKFLKMRENKKIESKSRKSQSFKRITKKKFQDNTFLDT